MGQPPCKERRRSSRAGPRGWAPSQGGWQGQQRRGRTGGRQDGRTAGPQGTPAPAGSGRPAPHCPPAAGAGKRVWAAGPRGGSRERVGAGGRAPRPQGRRLHRAWRLVAALSRRPPVRPGGARPAARRRGSEARCSGRAAGEVRPTEADLKKSERVECKFRQPGLSHPRSSAYEIMPLGKLLNQFKLQRPHL